MKCDNPYTVKLTAEGSGKHGINHAPVPCGKCYNCKATRVQQWAFRLEKELEVSTSAYFVTLTYNNEHVPITLGRYPMTLLKNSKQDENIRVYERSDDDVQNHKINQRSDRSLQAFFKRLRYYEEGAKILFDTRTRKIHKSKNVRFYACGEYGTARSRPHYHFIIFNLVDIHSIYKAWATAIVEKGVTIDYVPFGEIHIDDQVNSSNIQYVLKYICKEGKKQGGKGDYRYPEFSLCSKGLGKNWITPEIESFYNKRLDIAYIVNQQGVKIAMPKYFQNKMFNENTKDDRIIVIKNAMEELELLDERTEEQKVSEKWHRQKLMKNYSSRNID